MDHTCATESRRGLSCDTCGKYIKERLQSIGFKKFTGKDSMSPRVRAFLNTGEPDVMDSRVVIDGAGLD